jgi:uncharacterized membrane protein YbhN (UPF0104 family)
LSFAAFQGAFLIGAFGIRFMSLLVDATRNMVALWAVGVQIDFDQASVLVVASFVGTAISIVPAGLGVSEGAVAILSPLVGIDPAVGFLSATINRIVTKAGLGILSAALFASRLRGKFSSSHPLA